MMQILIFCSNEETTINKDGKEVCTMTKCAEVAKDRVIDAYTSVVGGNWVDNANKLAVSGWERFKSEREREAEAASGLQWQSQNLSSFIVNLKLLDELSEQVLDLSTLSE